MTGEFYLARDFMISYEGKPLKEIILINPEEVLWTSIKDAQERMRSTLGKIEAEELVVRRLFEISADAISKAITEKQDQKFKNSGKFLADISEFADLTRHYYYRDSVEEEISPPIAFLEQFLKLPIIRVVDEDAETIFVKFVC